MMHTKILPKTFYHLDIISSTTWNSPPHSLTKKERQTGSVYNFIRINAGVDKYE